MSAILDFNNYSMGFKDSKGIVYNLLDNVSFSIRQGQAIGIVGESGCGKSMTSLSVMRLLPKQAVVQGGEIFFQEEDLLQKTDREMQTLRGKKISMIFQEPMTSLNPVLSIGFQLTESYLTHNLGASKAEARKKAKESLELVEMPNAEARLSQYAHEFSGGMRQRVMIAMAMICNPELLIADEPTTALDVTIQMQILEVMKNLKNKCSYMVITHNLGVVAELCEEVVVMYAGNVVEAGSLTEIFDRPTHPYTQGLMAAIPTLSTEKNKLYTIPGSVPSIGSFGDGCRFAGRCSHHMEKCLAQKPGPIQLLGRNHRVACWLADDLGVSE